MNCNLYFEFRYSYQTCIVLLPIFRPKRNNFHERQTDNRYFILKKKKKMLKKRSIRPYHIVTGTVQSNNNEPKLYHKNIVVQVVIAFSDYFVVLNTRVIS